MKASLSSALATVLLVVLCLAVPTPTHAQDGDPGGPILSLNPEEPAQPNLLDPRFQPGVVAAEQPSVVIGATPTALGDVLDIDAGGFHTCAVFKSGAVQCWGDNGHGQLGQAPSAIARASLPVNVIGLSSDVVSIAAGAYHTCVVTSAGGVKCWGENEYGQLGDGTQIDHWAPVDAQGLTSGVRAVAAGGHHTCAVMNSGGVKCWGRNTWGALGDGTNSSRLTPVDVVGLGEPIRDVTAGGYHTCAMTESQIVKCWGDNDWGQLGDGTTIGRNRPGNAALEPDQMRLSAGWTHTCVLDTVGSTLCWGNNANGRLGDGTTTNRPTPVELSIPGGNGIAASEGGHTCAGGYSSVRCWGLNDHGQVGDGTNTERRQPVVVSGAGYGDELRAGAYHTCALQLNGMVLCWGSNAFGQLGDGSLVDRWAPGYVRGGEALPYDDVALAAQSQYLTVAPGANINPWVEVRNSGTSTWTPDQYRYNQKGVHNGWIGFITQNVAPGETYKIWWNEAAPMTPGVYDYGFVMARGAQEFGPYFFVRVTVVTYSISGRVTNSSGGGMAGVRVSTGDYSSTTNANGNYTITEVPAGSYTLTASKSPYAFTPIERYVSVPTQASPPNAKNQDFTMVGIDRIEVNQALGNTKNYVAGKNTAVRVFLKPGDYVKGQTEYQQLQIIRDGNAVAVLGARGISGSSNVLTFICDLNSCNGWQAGSYTFKATINGVSASASAVFRERRAMDILLVPIKVRDQGRDKAPSAAWRQATGFLSKVYPVAKVNTEPASKEIDATALNLNTESGRDELIKALEDQQSLLCGTIFAGANKCWDAIVGIMPEVPIGCDFQGHRCTKGWAKGVPPAVVVMETNELQSAVAHEVGHIVGFNGWTRMGLGDEYNGGVFNCDDNPPPASYIGLDRLTNAPKTCPTSTAVRWDEFAGTKISELGDAPLDVLGQSAMDDSLNFMGGAGYGPETYWISPSTYDYLFKKLVPIKALSMSDVATGEERILMVSGSIHRDGTVTFEPSYSFKAVPPATNVGSYQVEVLDAQGRQLAKQGFDVSFYNLANPPQEIDLAPYRVAVRFPPSARNIRIKHDGSILGEQMVSSGAPSISLIYPSSGVVWQAAEEYTIRWQGTDADGDTLHYALFYRQGSGQWSVVARNITNTQFTVDARTLAGGNDSYIRLEATDGFNSTAVELTSPFTVGSKPPEAWITYPVHGAILPPGLSFFLQASAFDPEDGALRRSSFSWRSDRDGDLGTGDQKLVTLSPGWHNITLTVTDSNGNAAQAHSKVLVGAKAYLPLMMKAGARASSASITAEPAATAVEPR